MTFKSGIRKFLLKYKLYSVYSVIYTLYSSFNSVFIGIALGRKKVLLLQLGNHSIKFDISDNYTKKWFYPLIKNNTVYEPVLTDFIFQHLNETSCFLDVGAHIGYFSSIAASKCKQGKVHAFEVDVNCLKYFKKNISINNFDNVTFNNVAISNSDEGVFIPDKRTPNNKTNIIVKRSKGRFVESVTLDSYLKANNLKPGLIKIDVEGAELKVLEGMASTLQLENLTLLIEVHQNMLEYYGYQSKEILERLIKNGFEVYELKDFRANHSKKESIDLQHQFVGNTLIVAVK